MRIDLERHARGFVSAEDFIVYSAAVIATALACASVSWALFSVMYLIKWITG